MLKIILQRIGGPMSNGRDKNYLYSRIRSEIQGLINFALDQNGSGLRRKVALLNTEGTGYEAIPIVVDTLDERFRIQSLMLAEHFALSTEIWKEIQKFRNVWNDTIYPLRNEVILDHPEIKVILGVTIVPKNEPLQRAEALAVSNHRPHCVWGKDGKMKFSDFDVQYLREDLKISPD